MTETPTEAHTIEKLVAHYKDEIRESIRCAVAEAYYRKNDLIDAEDALFTAFDAQAARIAKHEAYIAKLKESLVIRMSDDVCPECAAVMYDREPHERICSYFGLEYGIFKEATDDDNR